MKFEGLTTLIEMNCRSIREKKGLSQQTVTVLMEIKSNSRGFGS